MPVLGSALAHIAIHVLDLVVGGLLLLDNLSKQHYNQMLLECDKMLLQLRILNRHA